VIVLTFITVICGSFNNNSSFNEPAITDKLNPSLWLYVPRARRGDNWEKSNPFLRKDIIFFKVDVVRDTDSQKQGQQRPSLTNNRTLKTR